MSNKIDISQIKRDADIVQIIGKYVPGLKKKDVHFIAPCVFHKENTSSFYITPIKNIWKCFGCGKGGDVFDFLELQGMTKSEAIKYVSDPNNTQAVPYPVAQGESLKKEPKESVWKQVIPATPVEGMTIHYKHGRPSMVWEYLNENGALIGCVCRFETAEGKEVLPLIYATDGKVFKWVFRGFEKPRPLFFLDKLNKRPTKSVLLVEGEKTAAAAQLLYPLTNVTTWMGGAMGTKHTDWLPLRGRTVIMWPDNDEPGFSAMHEIYTQIKDIADCVKWVKNPIDAPKHWDLADSEWTSEEARSFSSKNIIDYPGPDYKYEIKIEENDIENIASNGLTKEEVKILESALNNTETQPPEIPPNEDNPNGFPLMGSEHFKILGAQKEGNGMIFHFYAFSTKTVIGLSPSAMTKNNLMQLAPLNWWKNSFYDSKSVFSVDGAANYLINKSSETGTFSDKWLRGRGAWMDSKRVVVHAGNKLFINGVETPLSGYKSKYIYEVGEELGFTVEKPLKNLAASKLMDLLKLLNWDRPINSFLLAGWCVVAPICGALNWRPHIWITGGAGTGKSWLFMKIVRPLLGETGLAVQGETSEAGLRQMLGHDALPVVFDEAEGEDRKSQDRMQSVLSLMRAASANDGGIMAKGSAGGSAKTYRIRSCFAFASIAVQLSQQSDRSRVTVLGLMKANGAKADSNWKLLQEKYDETVTEDFCTSLRSRTISLLPTILANVKTFSNAAAAVIGEQRAGDQIGVLLAGAYSLVSDKIINYDEAIKWVSEKDWTEERGLGSARDEFGLISLLLEYMIRVETQAATVERSIGELVLIALGLNEPEWNISPLQANDRLKRTGIRVIEDYLYISNSDANIIKILAGSPWALNHNKILLRIENAESVDSIRFSSGVKSRAVRIHKDILFKDFVPEIREKPIAPIDKIAKELLETKHDIYKQSAADFDN